MNAMVARIVGIVSIALGFILGMYGLDEQGSQWLQTALGLLVTGMLAQGYALYCSVKRCSNFTINRRHEACPQNALVPRYGSSCRSSPCWPLAAVPGGMDISKKAWTG